MDHRNVGGMDRGLQFILGLALIAGYFAQSYAQPDASFSWLYLVAGILGLLTGLVGRSRLNSLCRITTCRVK